MRRGSLLSGQKGEKFERKTHSLAIQEPVGKSGTIRISRKNSGNLFFDVKLFIHGTRKNFISRKKDHFLFAC